MMSISAKLVTFALSRERMSPVGDKRATVYTTSPNGTACELGMSGSLYMGSSTFPASFVTTGWTVCFILNLARS